MSNPFESTIKTVPEAETPYRKRGRPTQDASGGLRRALIEQSARLFQGKGCGNTAIRDIAAVTGVHAGSWFYYFRTKQDILRAMIEHGLTVALADIEAIDTEDLSPCETTHQFVHAHLHTILAPHQGFIPVMPCGWRSLDA